MAADNNWTAVVRNLSWVMTVWKRITRILIREGAEPRVPAFFFNRMVQVVMLFDSETWVVTPHMERSLGGFQD